MLLKHISFKPYTSTDDSDGRILRVKQIVWSEHTPDKSSFYEFSQQMRIRLATVRSLTGKSTAARSAPTLGAYRNSRASASTQRAWEKK
jgi:hypothetical protein